MNHSTLYHPRPAALWSSWMSQHTPKHLGHSSEVHSCRFPNKLLPVLSVNTLWQQGSGAHDGGHRSASSWVRVMTSSYMGGKKRGLEGSQSLWQLWNKPKWPGCCKAAQMAGWRKPGQRKPCLPTEHLTVNKLKAPVSHPPTSLNQPSLALLQALFLPSSSSDRALFLTM